MDAAIEKGLDLPPVMTSVPNVKVVDGVISITAVNNNKCDEEHLFSIKMTSFYLRCLIAFFSAVESNVSLS